MSENDPRSPSPIRETWLEGLQESVQRLSALQSEIGRVLPQMDSERQAQERKMAERNRAFEEQLRAQRGVLEAMAQTLQSVVAEQRESMAAYHTQLESLRSLCTDLNDSCSETTRKLQEAQDLARKDIGSPCFQIDRRGSPKDDLRILSTAEPLADAETEEKTTTQVEGEHENKEESESESDSTESSEEEEEDSEDEEEFVAELHATIDELRLSLSKSQQKERELRARFEELSHYQLDEISSLKQENLKLKLRERSSTLNKPQVSVTNEGKSKNTDGDGGSPAHTVAVSLSAAPKTAAVSAAPIAPATATARPSVVTPAVVAPVVVPIASSGSTRTAPTPSTDPSNVTLASTTTNMAIPPPPIPPPPPPPPPARKAGLGSAEKSSSVLTTTSTTDGAIAASAKISTAKVVNKQVAPADTRAATKKQSTQIAATPQQQVRANIATEKTNTSVPSTVPPSDVSPKFSPYSSASAAVSSKGRETNGSSRSLSPQKVQGSTTQSPSAKAKAAKSNNGNAMTSASSGSSSSAAVTPSGVAAGKRNASTAAASTPAVDQAQQETQTQSQSQQAQMRALYQLSQPATKKRKTMVATGTRILDGGVTLLPHDSQPPPARSRFSPLLSTSSGTALVADETKESHSKLQPQAKTKSAPVCSLPFFSLSSTVSSSPLSSTSSSLPSSVPSSSVKTTEALTLTQPTTTLSQTQTQTSTSTDSKSERKLEQQPQKQPQQQQQQQQPQQPKRTSRFGTLPPPAPILMAPSVPMAPVPTLNLWPAVKVAELVTVNTSNADTNVIPVTALRTTVSSSSIPPPPAPPLSKSATLLKKRWDMLMNDQK